MSILDLARADIIGMQAYVSARSNPVRADVLLNANESPWAWDKESAESGLRSINRYPDPQPRALGEGLADLYGVSNSEVLITRGSDEAIDLLIRAFCRPCVDSIVIMPPTFGMYAVYARVHGAPCVEVPLDAAFKPDFAALGARIPDSARLVFLCSPNNPTGVGVELAQVEALATLLRNRALLIVDEAYIEFADASSAACLLDRFENLCVLRTLSKAWALAGARIGCVLASPEVIGLLGKIIAPYPLPTPSVRVAVKALTASGRQQTQRRIAWLRADRERMANALRKAKGVIEVLPSQANFLCVRLADAQAAHGALQACGLLVRRLDGYSRLADCLRISMGRPIENARVLEVLAGGVHE